MKSFALLHSPDMELALSWYEQLQIKIYYLAVSILYSWLFPILSSSPMQKESVVKKPQSPESFCALIR